MKVKPSKYPRLDLESLFYRQRKHSRCHICQRATADTIVTVQVNWFRGDDEVFKVHIACYNELRQSCDRDPERILQALMSRKG